MNDLLEQLVANARQRARSIGVAPVKAATPTTRADLADALRGKADVAVIAEFKRRSPSVGDIAAGADIGDVVERYERAGAAAISVLTESTRFGGSFADLAAAAARTDLPLLMKDFVVDGAQVDHACSIGASGVLLIARCLTIESLTDLAARVVDLGMTPLIECHSEAELERAIAIEQAIIGVNNRDLDTLCVDCSHAQELLPHVPMDRIAVAESGYDRPEQVAELRGVADAVLVGTALMRGEDVRTFLPESGS